MVAFFWVGTPQKGMKIIKFGRHLVEGIVRKPVYYTDKQGSLKCSLKSWLRYYTAQCYQSRVRGCRIVEVGMQWKPHKLGSRRVGSEVRPRSCESEADSEE